jgi:hypothetical protein
MEIAITWFFPKFQTNLKTLTRMFLDGDRLLVEMCAMFPLQDNSNRLSLDAVAKCLPARPGGTTPIVAWHEVPGKRPSHETVP